MLRPSIRCEKAPTARKWTGNLAMKFVIRKAASDDSARLSELIRASVLGLEARDYTPAQIEGALAFVFSVDSQLIADGTYFVAEAHSEMPMHGDARPSESAPLIVGCGGWSKRKTLFGGDRWSGREDALLDPASDAAKIRAFFVDPEWARKGIASLILEACEAAAAASGFTRLEMGATLTGVPFYLARGYRERERLAVPLANGESMAIVHMTKQLGA
ncbi:MAG TPA: GNAT family N-acetyltransferase [Candidatus Acidoferrales bacterium]|nr:GNAT family N-acetyltransferase [Candidatus Acidoferrales bacterium]